MRGKESFELSYTLNPFLSLIFIGAGLQLNAEKDNPGQFTSVMIFLVVLFFLVILPFNFACYSLLKKYRSGEQLSDKTKIVGSLTYILFAILTILLLVGSVDLIHRTIQRGPNKKWINILFTLSFWCMTVTAVHLCFMYWIMRQKIKDVLANARDIEQLGKDIEN